MKRCETKFRMRWPRVAIITGAMVCAATPAAFSQTTIPPSQTIPSPTSAPAARSITIVDDAGRTITVPQPVRRIVSLAPSVTETIYALHADDRLVGDTTFCNYPPDAQKKTKVGGPFTPNLEEVVALKPDLVIVAANSGNRKETAEALDALHIPTYATDGQTMAAVLASIQKLSGVIGSSEQGATLVAGLQARLDEIHRRLANMVPARVLFVVWRDPLMSIGNDTFLADALRAAGAKSVIETRENWPRISMEAVVHEQPDDLVFASDDEAQTTASLSDLRTIPGWRDLNAVRDNHLIVVSDAINMPAPRLVDAVEELARKLHPEAFADAPKVNSDATMHAGARR
jgi:iron complex transport system substrate-binding protein